MTRDAHIPRLCPHCSTPIRSHNLRCHGCGKPRPDSGWPTDELVGRTLEDKYRIIRKIGHGGMGSVYLAEHVHEGQSLGRVAIKLLQPRGSDQARAQLAESFIAEVTLARLFDNPHIVQIYDMGCHGQLPFMVMEVIRGEELLDLILRKDNLSAPLTVAIALQLAEALREIHGHDVVHRDIKPENVLILEGRDPVFVKLLDFGIAKKIVEGADESTRVGTPAYMPPEQARGEAIDHRADIYALGVLMFHCLTGEPPLQLDTPASAPASIELSRSDLPVRLTALIDSMMSPMHDNRPDTISDVITVLEHVRTQIGEPESPDPPAPDLPDRLDSNDAIGGSRQTLENLATPGRKITLDRDVMTEAEQSRLPENPSPMSPDNFGPVGYDLDRHDKPEKGSRWTRWLVIGGIIAAAGIIALALLDYFVFIKG